MSKPVQMIRTVRISSIVVSGTTVAARWAIFREAIEPELEAQRKPDFSAPHVANAPKEKAIPKYHPPRKGLAYRKS